MPAQVVNPAVARIHERARATASRTHTNSSAKPSAHHIPHPACAKFQVAPTLDTAPISTRGGGNRGADVQAPHTRRGRSTKPDDRHRARTNSPKSLRPAPTPSAISSIQVSTQPGKGLARRMGGNGKVGGGETPKPYRGQKARTTYGRSPPRPAKSKKEKERKGSAEGQTAGGANERAREAPAYNARTNAKRKTASASCPPSFRFRKQTRLYFAPSTKTKRAVARARCTPAAPPRKNPAKNAAQSNPQVDENRKTKKNSPQTLPSATANKLCPVLSIHPHPVSLVQPLVPLRPPKCGSGRENDFFLARVVFMLVVVFGEGSVEELECIWELETPALWHSGGVGCVGFGTDRITETNGTSGTSAPEGVKLLAG
ncbi:hypothetical protein C8F04DRAFT_1319225 [Mycena alexandri]|uniref:Uncharacterized protein n=1 Tax=Mycena alexandri TaxID=1745969 RepID=A0AAD6S5B4_9AGAR|nr:hypothetical protein C8F04DRAFT_1319225 [Mycena alexandri]